jgi:hypothetical protein
MVGLWIEAEQQTEKSKLIGKTHKAHEYGRRPSVDTVVGVLFKILMYALVAFPVP